MGRHRQNYVYSLAVLGFAKLGDDLHQQRVKKGNVGGSQGPEFEAREQRREIWMRKFICLP